MDFTKMNGGKVQILVTTGECLLDFSGLYWSGWYLHKKSCRKICSLVSSAPDLLNQGSTVIQHMASNCITKLACVHICVL